MNGSPAVISPDAEDPILSVRDLSSGYGRSTIVRKVNLEVRRGSVTALLGPNGAGKTTLLSTISGLIAAKEGRIVLQGRDLTGDAPERRAKGGLCHIPQGRGVYRSLTVRENLLMQAPRGRERESLERATTAFPVLARRIGQRAGTLSGGEQQMVSMAAAYVRGAEVILADEPSLGLAPIIIDQIFVSLRHLAGEGIALLLVDQFVSQVLDMADHAYVLRHGEIAFEGAASKLKDQDVFAHYLGQ
ncbi:MAG TPA: ABC transporter ATP-binding protein [Jatrophihabitantaceae bacterium]|jgi:branched-chain amino acid transport system ATP-binding protein|nr:ABC transporter ATP-binding protein [Jatrophihabitantaceae bacterium]